MSKEKRERNLNWNDKSVDDEKEKRGSRNDKMQRRNSVSKEKRERNLNWNDKSVDDEKEKRGSRNDKMQRRNRGEEKNRRSAEKAEKYREKRGSCAASRHCTYCMETENVMTPKDFHAVSAYP